jgi:lipopolysaccharide transport system permease protein
VEISSPEPVVVRPPARWAGFGLRDLWAHRELLYFFAWRDIKIRYKQTFLGVTWAVLQPILYMVVFTLFFGKLAGLYTAGTPYAVLTLTGSVIWLFFANCVTYGPSSLVGNSALITKVSFPRLLVPAATVAAGIVDLALSMVVMFLIMAGYGYYPSLRNLMLIPFFLLALGTAFGVTAWLAALNVKYRDVRFAIPFLLQLWLFASSVFYSFQALSLPEPWQTIYWLNPMAGVVEGFRWSLIGGVHPSVSEIALSTLGGLVALAGGLIYFRRLEKRFADII